MQFQIKSFVCQPPSVRNGCFLMEHYNSFQLTLYYSLFLENGNTRNEKKTVFFQKIHFSPEFFRFLEKEEDGKSI